MASSPRILLTSDAIGGVWSFTSDLAAALVARGWRPTIAIVGPAPSATQRRSFLDATHGEADLVETGTTPEWLASSPGEALRTGRALAEIAADVQPALLHLNASADAVGWNPPCPVIITHHSCVGTWFGAVHPRQELPPDLRWRHQLTSRGLREAALVVAPTAAFAEAAHALHREAMASRPIVIPNGRAWPLELGEMEEAADEVISAGRLWDPGKNAAAVDAAAARLDCRVTLAGPTIGPDGQRFEARHAETTGRLEADALRARLATRPIFVSPALYEPFGLSVLEAAQQGCALVLSRIGSFLELWSDAAIFVDPRDPGAIVAAVRRLLVDPALREDMGYKARRRARNYTLGTMCARYQSLYARLCSDPALWRAHQAGVA